VKPEPILEDGEAENMVPVPGFEPCTSSASLVIIPARNLLKIVINLQFSLKGEKNIMVAERLLASYAGLFSAVLMASQ
jgi:hypothetical protein